MLRQRLRSRDTSPLVLLGRLFTLLFAAALFWYGLMVVLLAVKVSPSTVNSISGYRTAFDWLSGLTPADVDGSVRAIVAGAGLLLFLLCGWIALKALPRPYLARHDLVLAQGDRGGTRLEPRAIERLAEGAAGMQPGVSDARGRYGEDDLAVNVRVKRARDVAGTLDGAQKRVVEALDRHGVPSMPVTVTLTGYDRQRRRELN
jgi:hypothetical protein